MKKPSVELRLPILPNMELIATQTAEVISRHMNLTDDQAGEISMALIEACINAFEHSKAERQDASTSEFHKKSEKLFQEIQSVRFDIFATPSIIFSNSCLRLSTT